MTRFIINNLNGRVVLSVDMITYVRDDYHYFHNVFDRHDWVTCSLAYRDMDISILENGLLKVTYCQDDGNITEDVAQYVVIDYKWMGNYISVKLLSDGNMWEV